MSRELFVIESNYPDGIWHPLLIGEQVFYTFDNAVRFAERHMNKYPKEVCRVVRYIPATLTVTNSRGANAAAGKPSWETQAKKVQP
jgi:hypothetical protein